jgi:Na+-transporting NADH:ubiquinone oxidoreductase subunit NqrB
MKMSRTRRCSERVCLSRSVLAHSPRQAYASLIFDVRQNKIQNHMSVSEKLGTSFGCLFMIAFLAYGLVQIYAGYIGIDYHWGSGWAIGALVACLIFRFSLPITIGSFFAARDVWDWHWSLALLFAAPGLAFMALMIPGAIASVVAKFKR